MNIVHFGPPGAGKGTQGEILAAKVGVTKIATGDLLRAAVKAGTMLGTRARDYMDRGLLVPDQIILGLIEDKLSAQDAERGVIMDGFPRTINQAEAVDGLLAARGKQVDRVLALDVPDDELVRRMVGRAQEERRSDDTADAIRKRLQVYRQETAPLLQYYQERGIVTNISATGTVDDVAERVAQAMPA